MPRQLIQHHRFFLGIFSLYIVVGAFSFLFYKQGSETLFLDSCHCEPWDTFFVIMTKLAEGLSILLVGLILFAWRVKYGLVYLIDLLVLYVVVHLLKHQVFADHIRPSMFFGPTQHLHFIEGMPVFRDFSFPSGHTATAFAVSFLLAIFVRRTWASMIFLALALLVGLSRIYLLQHFWIDVYFGSLIGVTVTLLVYIALQKPLIHSESSILNFSLVERLTKRS
ncbi:MAG: rane-associated phospholipid phosphatase [Bacteroidetes bacterium]|nr:rane-associated phospholipid phosphatase [Bacteroidota bacterium]